LHILVPTGGRLLDDYVTMQISRSELTKLEDDVDFKNKCFQNCNNGFIVSILQNCYGHSQCFGKFLYSYWSREFTWKGLSLHGLEILHKHQLAPSISNYQILHKSSIQDYKTETEQLLKKYFAIYWLDNYNLMLKYSSLRKTPYENCNWTVFAAKVSGIGLINYTIPTSYVFDDVASTLVKLLLEKTSSQIN